MAYVSSIKKEKRRKLIEKGLYGVEFGSTQKLLY